MFSTKHFQLQPFTAESMTESITISGYVARRSGALQVEYRIKGALDRVNWFGSSPVTGRCHELWRQTCFELFLGVKNDSAYWEVNLSPNKCWNVYHFTDYRTGMNEERSVSEPCFHVVKDGDLLSLMCTIELNNLIDDSSDLEVGVSSVIKATDGNSSYWAIDHHGTEPDFHNRKGLNMLLPGLRYST